MKKEQKEAPPSTNADASESPDEIVAPPAPAQHHHGGHDDGIFNGYKKNRIVLHQFLSSKLTKCISQHQKKFVHVSIASHQSLLHIFLSIPRTFRSSSRTHTHTPSINRIENKKLINLNVSSP